jgi:hypothetical protein
MKYNNFISISKTEIEDCESTCRRHGLDFSEFSLREHDVTEPEEGVYYISGQITFSRNGASRTYKTGNGTSWPVNFDVDVQNGFFGNSRREP